VVDDLLVRASQRAEFLRQSKGDHKVVDRQEQTLLVFEPLLGLAILALGTVPVLARVVTVMVLLAMVTEIEPSAKNLSAAAFNLLHGPEMRGEHAISEFSSVVGTVEAEDLGQLDHQRSLKRRLIASTARCSALRVRWV
jgi:hypothetical protein